MTAAPAGEPGEAPDGREAGEVLVRREAGEALVGREAGDALVGRVIALGRSLQAGGVNVAQAELIDAGRAAALTDLGSREDLRTALRATMVKDPRHFGIFDAAFERLFPLLAGGGGPDGDATRAGLARLIASGGNLGPAAARLVDDLGGLDRDRRGERHHVQRVCRGADLARLMSEALRAAPGAAPEDLRLRIEELKRLIASEVRARLGEARIDATDEAEGPLEDVEFLKASRAELDRVRGAVRPLARKLAGRLARRRRGLRSDRVNMRRTARRSVSSGGVPFDVAFHRRSPRRPELFVLCDISGSVAEFSLFTLTLMAALSAEVARTRSFVFVGAVDEVTALLKATGHGIEPWQIMRNTNVIGADGHSDYGRVLDQFWAETAERDLRPSATVLITGDARTNYRPAGAEALARIGDRARRLYWLNPEPKDRWDTRDSQMGDYARSCTEVFEVRNLRQLASCVERIL